MAACFKYCLLLLVVAVSTTAFPRKNALNNRPIIGILAQHSPSPYGDEHVEAMYVRYLEMAGARVVPVRGKQPKSYYEKLFNSVNGILFPGGGVDLQTSPYAQSGKYLYQMAIEANKRGDYFPIWGTCLGFELLSVLTAKENVLSDTDTENMTLPLKFVSGFKRSRLIRNMPDDLVEILTSEAVTQNNHIYSLLTETYENSTILKDFFQMISTSVGRDGKEFVSVFEAWDYPMYGTQWHPEKNLFLWRTDERIDHDLNAVRVSQYMANFFVNEARKNAHHYDSTDEEAHAVIENSVRIFKPDFSIGEVFYFNYTNQRRTYNHAPVQHKFVNLMSINDD